MRRLLMVARTRYTLPLQEGPAQKFAALRDRFDLRVLATSADGRARDDGVFHLVGRQPLLDGPLFYALFPFRLRRLVRGQRPDAVVAQSPYEAALARFAGVRLPLVVELHGDWRTATRLYGSPFRRLLAPIADAVGGYGVRHADAVRTLSPYTTGLARAAGVEPVGEFPASAGLELFAQTPPTPLPDTPAVLFVGVLERYKNVDGLARAWRLAAPELPGVKLTILGRGSERETVGRLVAELPAQTVWIERRSPSGVAGLLDAVTCLVLPSRSEGLPRIVMEAFLRGRPVIGADAGGIPDGVEDGVNGLLVGSDEELAGALVRLLRDPELAGRLAAGAAESATRWLSTPEEFAECLAEVVEGAIERRR
jgi:glycosyltransferase involved in cell wall biosynthesis